MIDRAALAEKIDGKHAKICDLRAFFERRNNRWI
jgi:hypothetical protein